MRRQIPKKKPSSRYISSIRSIRSTGSAMYMSSTSIKKPFDAKDYVMFGCSERDVELYREVAFFIFLKALFSACIYFFDTDN